MTDYIPRPGDLVKFPGAPVKANQDRIYEITDENILTYQHVTGGWVEFRLYCCDSAHIYRKELGELSAIGMKLVRSVDKLDPIWSDDAG